MSRSKTSLYIALFVAFVDFMGMGLVYPIFSSMLFDSSYCLVSADTSAATRGTILGFLVAIMPLTQFFTAPIWGALSDSKGRKKPLQMSLIVTVAGYGVALFSVLLNSLILLFVSRCIIGAAAGNMSIVQATIADVSRTEEKAKNFGLYSMVLGIGFTLGPFFGGALSSWGYSIPFLFATCVAALNLIFAYALFKETHFEKIDKRLSWKMGIDHLKKAFAFKGVRIILLASFLHCFAWSYFFEFIPVHLIARFHFTPFQLGVFYGIAGAFYAICSGILIRPFLQRFKPETLFFAGNFLTSFTVIAIVFLPSSFWIWPILFLMAFFAAFVTPSSTTLISNSAQANAQGEALGVLSSVNAAAFSISPIFSGTFVGNFPTLPMWVGGIVMLIAALSVLAIFRQRLFQNQL